MNENVIKLKEYAMRYRRAQSIMGFNRPYLSYDRPLGLFMLARCLNIEEFTKIPLS